MRRGILLSVLVGIGALSLGAARPGGSSQGQAPMVVEVEKVKDNLYVLKGGGGNTALFITASGVVVVQGHVVGLHSARVAYYEVKVTNKRRCVQRDCDCDVYWCP